MRALFLFLIVVVAFLLVLRFYPSDGVEGAEERPAGPGAVTLDDLPDETPDEATGRGKLRFLEGPDTSARPTRGASEPDRGREPEPAERVERSGGGPDWLRSMEATPVRSAGGDAEIALAEALLHGSASEVARLLDDPALELSEERCFVVMAFKEAMDGRRQRALQHAQELGEDVSWAPNEEERLRAALTGAAFAARPSRAREEGPLAFSMEMSLAAREGQVALQERRHAQAAALFSELLVNELDAPWESRRGALATWGESLNRAQDEHQWNPRGTWNGVEMVVETGDSLTVLRKRYVERYPERRMCTGLIAKANRLRGYLQPGQKLRVPTGEVEVLVDLSACRVLYFLGGQVARTYEIGIGRAGQETITGTFVVGEKQENPPWFPRGQDMVPFGDPRNPLGTRWIAWFQDGGKTSYGFHGTNDPESIGTAASDGCIRFRNEEVEEFFELVPLGTPVVVRP